MSARINTTYKHAFATTLSVVAILIGVGIGYFVGNFSRETKLPGDAIRVDDATGHWKRYNEPTEQITAQALTNSRIRLLMQALPTYALTHGGVLPKELKALVSSGLLGESILLDGWGRAFIYEVNQAEETYTVHSLGSDGVPSADDIPQHPQE